MNIFPDQILFLLGAILVLIYILSPFLYSYFKTPDNAVWVPINHQNKLPGDNRIYAAGVRSARESFFRHKHPCSDSLGVLKIDISRYISYRLAALLTFGINDLRIAYLVSYILSIVINYGLIFLIAFTITNDSLFSLFISLLVLLFYNNIFELLTNPFNLKSANNHLFLVLLKKYDKNFLFVKNDLLRYVVLSVSSIFIWLYILILLFINPSENIFQYLLISIIVNSFTLFVYPSVFLVTISNYLVQLPNIVNNINMLVVVIIMILVSIMIILFKNRIKRLIYNIINKKKDLSKYYNFKKIKKNNSVYLFLIVNINIIFLYIYLNLNILDHFLLLFIIAGMIAEISHKDNYIKRFFNRGIKHVYVFTFFIFIHHISLELINYTYQELFYLISVIIMCMIIILTAINYSYLFYKMRSFYLHRNEWDIIQVLHNKFKNKTILTFDAVFLQLLPVYSNTKLEIRGAEWLENAYNELQKFLYYSNKIYSNIDFIKLFDSYHVNSDIYNEDNRMYIESLLYTRIKQVNGIEYFSDETKKWNPEFLELIEKLKNKEVVKNNWDIAILSKKYHINDKLSLIKLYENDDYIIVEKILNKSKQ